MVDKTLTSNVFTKPLEGRLMHDDLLQPTRKIKTRFDSCARDDKVQIHWQDQPWPSARMEIAQQPVAEGNHYRFLSCTRFDADINVMVVPSLEELGPELGYLLDRRRGYLHSFVVSMQDLPDRWTDRDLYKGLTAVPPRNKVERDRNTLWTQAELFGVRDVQNPEQRGTLSFHSYQKMSRFRILNLLQLVALRATA